jgi:hypothetical protein
MRRVLTRSHDLEVQQWALWGQVATPVGIGGVVVCAAIVLSSFLPGAPFILNSEVVGRALLVLVLPVFFGTVLALRLGGTIGTRNTVLAFLGLPRVVLRLTLVVAVAFAVAGLTGLGSSSLATDERDGRYVATDDGEAVELSSADHDKRQAEASRRAAATAGVAYTVLAAAGLLVRKEPEAIPV